MTKKINDIEKEVRERGPEEEKEQKEKEFT